MSQLKYYFEKLPNGNVVLWDVITERILKSFNPSATIEKIDETRIAVSNMIGAQSKFIFDYRKLAVSECIPEIGTALLAPTIDEIFLALSNDFFFLTKGAGGTKIINYSFRNVKFSHPFGTDNGWFSNNLSQNASDTAVSDGVFFNIVNEADNLAYPLTNFTFLGEFGVYKNTLKENSYIKRMVIDIDAGSSITVSTDFNVLLHQHSLQVNAGNEAIISLSKKVTEEEAVFQGVVSDGKYRKVFEYTKPNAYNGVLVPVFEFNKVLKPDSRLSLLLKSTNDKDNIVFKTLNVQLELEKI